MPKSMTKVLHVTVTTAAGPATVRDYLRDFTHATEWDSGTESCVRTFGNGGVGTVYRNVSRFGGQKVQLDYTVERDEPEVFEIVGRAKGTVGRDTITFTPASGGTKVDYHADFSLDVPWLIRPVVSFLLDRLARDTQASLQAALDRLPR
ncbi:MAG TPA: SRPBCC family protein [Propionibacteriaceae bacterium]|nr:SRPBCC family protein [Propionibacteriaceae bacterium]HPZ48805.1 SRPBCC family protein [Propionibacteriaceae bacterium]